jgi:hypothetical protein
LPASELPVKGLRLGVLGVIKTYLRVRDHGYSGKTRDLKSGITEVNKGCCQSLLIVLKTRERVKNKPILRKIIVLIYNKRNRRHP